MTYYSSAKELLNFVLGKCILLLEVLLAENFWI